MMESTRHYTRCNFNLKSNWNTKIVTIKHSYKIYKIQCKSIKKNTVLKSLNADVWIHICIWIVAISTKKLYYQLLHQTRETQHVFFKLFFHILPIIVIFVHSLLTTKFRSWVAYCVYFNIHSLPCRKADVHHEYTRQK